MKKLNVAIITGGIVAERGISLKSAKTIHKHLNRRKYTPYLIDFDGKNFIEISSKKKLSKVDFSFSKDGKKVKIDLAFLMLHGSPAEDGKLQGYLEIMGIPYTGCDVFVSSLTFDKQACKTFLKDYEIPMADSQLIRRGEKVNVAKIAKMGFPQFVKPNKNGSSYGVTKINEKSEIKSAIEKAMQFDDEVIIEAFLKGREFSNGVFRKGDEIIVLPITEIISKNDFFDYIDFSLYKVSIQHGVKVNTNTDGNSTINMDNIPDFFEKITTNTGYIIHPDEIIADNFMYIMMREKKNGLLRSFTDDGVEKNLYDSKSPSIENTFSSKISLTCSQVN